MSAILEKIGEIFDDYMCVAFSYSTMFPFSGQDKTLFIAESEYIMDCAIEKVYGDVFEYDSLMFGHFEDPYEIAGLFFRSYYEWGFEQVCVITKDDIGLDEKYNGNLICPMKDVVEMMIKETEMYSDAHRLSKYRELFNLLLRKEQMYDYMHDKTEEEREIEKQIMFCVKDLYPNVKHGDTVPFNLRDDELEMEFSTLINYQEK